MIAIKSHTHLPCLADFFQAALQHVLPRGIVILVDDMLAGDGSNLTHKDMKLLDAFKRGWRMGHVPTVSQVLEQAKASRFEVVAHRDLGELLRLYQPRDLVLNGIAPQLDWLGMAALSSRNRSESIRTVRGIKRLSSKRSEQLTICHQGSQLSRQNHQRPTSEPTTKKS